MGRRGAAGFSVTTLVCLGLGYVAQHYAGLYGARFDRIVGTTRSAESAAAIAALRLGGRAVEMVMFDAAPAAPVPPALLSAIADASALLVSIAPHAGADPVLAHMREAIVAAPRLASIVYLSTIAVYGNHDGGWIDEDTALTPALTAKTRAARLPLTVSRSAPGPSRSTSSASAGRALWRVMVPVTSKTMRSRWGWALACVTQ